MFKSQFYQNVNRNINGNVDSFDKKNEKVIFKMINNLFTILKLIKRFIIYIIFTSMKFFSLFMLIFYDTIKMTIYSLHQY